MALGCYRVDINWGLIVFLFGNVGMPAYAVVLLKFNYLAPLINCWPFRPDLPETT